MSRRARRYRAAYLHEIERGGGAGVLNSHELIEKFVKKHKCHRCIQDQETSFLNATMADQGDNNIICLQIIDEEMEVED
jgi:hypothetical protein